MTLSSQHRQVKPCIEHGYWLRSVFRFSFCHISLHTNVYKTGTRVIIISDQHTCQRQGKKTGGSTLTWSTRNLFSETNTKCKIYWTGQKKYWFVENSLRDRSWWVALCKNGDSSMKETERTVEKSLLVCTFQYSEKPKGMTKKHRDTSSYSVTSICTGRTTVSWNKDEKKIKVPAYISKLRFDGPVVT